jgi:glycosyltransferase involved in cell wall biosynthesis
MTRFMKTITHIFKTYFPDTQGGLEEAIRQIGKYSIKNGFNVNVISVSHNPSTSVLEGIKCHSFKYSFGSNSLPVSLGLASDFNEIIKETDILHLHFPYPFGELLTILNHVKKPIVITFHCEILNRSLIRLCYEPFARVLFNKASIIVPTSTNLLNSTKILQRFKQKTEVINLWLDESRFDNLNNVDDVFKERVKDFGEFSLFIGVLRWYKGLDVLLDAAKIINGNVVIVGKGSEKVHLEKRIKDENISNVYLTGFLSDSEVIYLLSKCKFTVLPSISPAEAFGQVLLESCYYSKPMVTTELGTGTSYVNINSKTGFVVSPNSSSELSIAMVKLFENNELCNKMGDMAYKRYKENFSADVLGDKYIKIYDNLLKSNVL